MKITRRKLTLQLTPLLDLMLIVFFLQYLQLRENEVKRASAADVDQSRRGPSRRGTRSRSRIAADATKSADEVKRQLAEERQRSTAGLENVAASERAQTEQLAVPRRRAWAADCRTVQRPAGRRRQGAEQSRGRGSCTLASGSRGSAEAV